MRTMKKDRFYQIISIILVCIMAISPFYGGIGCVHAASSVDGNPYQGAGYEVSWSVSSQWEEAYAGNITIKNIGWGSIEDWSISFSSQNEITQIWNADIVSYQNGVYILKNAGWNKTIPIAGSVHFGFIASGEPVRPLSFHMIPPDSSSSPPPSPEPLPTLEPTSAPVLTATPPPAPSSLPSQTPVDLEWVELEDGKIDAFYLKRSIIPHLILNGMETDSIKLSDDYDNDGLTLSQEYEQDTNPFEADTDEDGINDYEELNVFLTDPLNPDTDEDGLKDGAEAALGFQPANPDSDGNGIPDGKEKTAQTLTADLSAEEKDAVQSVAVQMECPGWIDDEVTISSVFGTDPLTSEIVGLVGVPVEINTDLDFEQATITFTYDPNKLGAAREEDLTLMRYNESENEYVLLEDDSVSDSVSHTVSCTTNRFSTYLLVDKRAWQEAWETRLDYEKGKDIAFVLDISDHIDYHNWKNGRRFYFPVLTPSMKGIMCYTIKARLCGELKIPITSTSPGKTCFNWRSIWTYCMKWTG